jgi:hypothetical protein
MFRILTGLKFYRGDAISANLREAHGIVSRAVASRLAEKAQR